MKESRNSFLSAGSAAAFAIIVLVLVTSAAVTAAHAQTYTVLYNFGGVPGDPQYPSYGPIAQGRDGNLYATTSQGGNPGLGTAFKITPTGTLTVLHNFGGATGDHPDGGLALGLDGTFYGTTSYGGSGKAGTVFQMTPEGKWGLLYAFSKNTDGKIPVAPPIQGRDGNLYGTTSGFPPNLGSVYKITSPQHITTLHQFTGGSDGSGPLDPLLQATDGSFYGTTYSGTAFKIGSTGTFTSLGTLPGLSSSPLIQADNGYLYGVTIGGGTYDQGSVFEMTATGKTRVLHDFYNLNGDGYWPRGGLVQATDGNFYGTTSTSYAVNYPGGGIYGTIYRLSPSGDFSVLYYFQFDDGFGPVATMVQHTNGILYGTTSAGGPYNAGTFFSLDIGAPPFVRLVTTFGKVGQTIGILGQGFTGATDVSFNGIPATYTVSSDTYLEATVPAGATTGFVTVTASTGTLTSNQQMQIRQ